MSLLLEALKKAELAKQGAQPASSKPTEIEFTPSSPVSEKPIITRENLPDITQQLEITSEDLLSSGSTQISAEAATPLRPASSLSPSSRTAPEPIFTEESVEPAQDQAAAKQLFDAKGLEDYNPRKPFYYTLAALGVFAIGAIGYFWWQLQPRYIVAPTTVANTPARAPEPIAPAAAPAAVDPLASPGPNIAPSGAVIATPVNAVPDQATRPALAQSAPPAATTPVTRPVVPAASSANSPVVISRSVPQPIERTSAPRPRQSGTRVTPSMSSAARTDQQLEQAFDAYQKGDLATARQAYSDALKTDPSNRDAMLGLAAIDARSGQFDSAEARYLKLLESDPRDAHALSGLIALRGQADPVQSESRLKSLIANQPEAGFLHFALGNQMALQARWSEAQAAYFKALASEPDNPDYAYNLAVSLDHIRQGKLALDYYQKALTLSGTRPSTFDRTRATTRIRELQQ